MKMRVGIFYEQRDGTGFPDHTGSILGFALVSLWAFGGGVLGGAIYQFIAGLMR